MRLQLAARHAVVGLLGFFLGFAVKVPMFPFHTWLPDAHTEAPTAGSVILASVLLKMGTYGFLRFSLPLLPKPRHEPDDRQIHGDALDHRHRLRRAGLPDAEGLEEAGRVFLGQPPGLLHARDLRAESRRDLRQSIIQQINHGISTGMLFLIVGVVYERRLLGKHEPACCLKSDNIGPSPTMTSVNGTRLLASTLSAWIKKEKFFRGTMEPTAPIIGDELDMPRRVRSSSLF